MLNKQILLAARPVGLPKESDFTLLEGEIQTVSSGELIVQVLYLSLDPYMRGRMSDAKSYAEPLAIGDVMIGAGVGKVVHSNHRNFRVGDIVEGMLGWQQHSVSKGATLRKIDPAIAPISTALGVLGMPGLTAYFGLLDICQPKPGETVVISGAAGAVGSCAGQIAKIKGCRVIGIAGSDDKVEYLTGEFGFDAAFNYKRDSDYLAKLQELCPNGIDCYFDNVGGAITDAVLRHINTKARIAICGQISQYNLEKPELGPRILSTLLIKTAKAQGFLVFQYAERYAEGLTQLAAWLRDGKLKYREEIAEGIENAPRAFIGMLQGQNTGKQLVRVAAA